MHKLLLQRGLMLTFLLTSAAACADKSIDSSTSSTVAIYNGLYLGDLLAEPKPVQSVADLPALMQLPWYAGVEVAKQGNSSTARIINTCNEYFVAQAKGLQPIKEFERSAYQEFGLMCLAARDISSAKPASTGYIKRFKLEKNSPTLLPKQLALVISQAEYQRLLEDKTKQVWAQVDAVKTTQVIDPYQIKYIFASAEQTICLVASGDFNHDGVDDLLLTSKDQVSGGSYHGMRMWLMTQYKADAEFIILKTYHAL